MSCVFCPCVAMKNIPYGQSSAKLPVMMSTCHPVFWSTGHLVIRSSGHQVIRSPGHQVISSQIIRSSGHDVIMSSFHYVIMSSGHPVIQSFVVIIIFQHCYIQTDGWTTLGSTGLLRRQKGGGEAPLLPAGPRLISSDSEISA